MGRQCQLPSVLRHNHFSADFHDSHKRNWNNNGGQPAVVLVSKATSHESGDFTPSCWENPEQPAMPAVYHCQHSPGVAVFHLYYGDNIACCCAQRLLTSKQGTACRKCFVIASLNTASKKSLYPFDRTLRMFPLVNQTLKSEVPGIWTTKQGLYFTVNFAIKVLKYPSSTLQNAQSLISCISCFPLLALFVILPVKSLTFNFPEVGKWRRGVLDCTVVPLKTLVVARNNKIFQLAML